MYHLRATQCCFVVVVCLFLGLQLSFAQPNPNRADSAPDAVASITPPADTSIRAIGRVRLQGGLELTYLGMFSPDAVFHNRTRTTGANGHVPGEGIPPATPSSQDEIRREVPPWMLLSNERIVQDVEPPGHSIAAAEAHPLPAEVRNHFVTFVYARPSVINAPRHIVTDSQHRVIVSDPSESAVHVLDPHGTTSFRILAGAGFRLREPAGVAVDADDNIYVADAGRGIVDVFDRNGNFLRYVGTYHGEAEFAQPDGITIDVRSKRLYVIDRSASTLFVLDLSGRVLKRLARSHGGDNLVEFDHPIDVAVNHQHVYVLDRWGTRLQILDLALNPVRKIDIALGRPPEQYRYSGISTDERGHVYVSSCQSSMVNVYSPDGRFLTLFGQAGIRAGEFASPGGLWIDPENHLYVADSGNGRVQMFQLDFGE